MNNTPDMTPTPLLKLCDLATPGPWKQSNYRPHRLLARSPRESTYRWGDDKYPSLAEAPNSSQGVNDIKFIARLSPEVARRIHEFLKECEIAEDRSNLDGDSAEEVLKQINDEAEKLLRLLDGLEEAK